MPFNPSSYQDILGQLAGTDYSLGGVNSAKDVRKRFGLSADVRSVFGPAKANLATRRAQSLSSASARMGNRYANPEAGFAGIEGEYAGAFGDLESQEANARLGDEQNIAQMLLKILSGGDEFGLRKLGMQSNVLGQKKEEDRYEDSKPGLFDDILAILGGGAQIANPVLGYLGQKGIASAIGSRR